MRYDVVVIPETFHRFDKHNIEHVCVPLITGDRSYDIAMEIVNGLHRVLEMKFSISFEELDGDECTELYRKYAVERDGKKATVHLKLRKRSADCPPIHGNSCSVIEFERDIECIVRAIEECLA